MPVKITAGYRIVTPMFIGDAEQKASGISPAAVKGALRFWWRALNWGRILKDAKTQEDALKTLHAQEIRLFGGLPETRLDEQSGNKWESGGQGVFLLRVVGQNNHLATLDDWPTATSFSGYLGIGLWASGNSTKGNYQAHRQAIEEGQDFSVELLLKPTARKEDKNALHDTLQAWGWFGGLGSRVRRGFGSIALEQLDGMDMAFANTNDYIESTKSLLTGYAVDDAEPPYTAFSSRAMIGLSVTKISARLAHEELGRLFKNYRGQPSRLRGSKKRVFGMPYRGGTPAEAKARRASPLIFHVHPIANKYQGLVLSLPAAFHHEPTLSNVDNTLLSGLFQHLHGVSLW